MLADSELGRGAAARGRTGRCPYCKERWYRSAAPRDSPQRHKATGTSQQVRFDKILARGVDEILSARDRYSSHNPIALVLIAHAKKFRSQSDLARQRGVIILIGESVNDFGGQLRTRLGG